MKVTAIWLRMALSLQPRKRVILRFCLIHLKNSSTLAFARASLPALFVEFGDLFSRAGEIIGEQPQDLAGIDADGDLAPLLGERLAPLGGETFRQKAGLIGQHAAAW